jgi:hypothetical protein
MHCRRLLRIASRHVLKSSMNTDRNVQLLKDNVWRATAAKDFLVPPGLRYGSVPELLEASMYNFCR